MLCSIESVSGDPAFEFDSAIIELLDSSSGENFPCFVIEEDQYEISEGGHLEVRLGHWSCVETNTNPVDIAADYPNACFNHYAHYQHPIHELLLSK